MHHLEYTFQRLRALHLSHFSTTRQSRGHKISLKNNADCVRVNGNLPRGCSNDSKKKAIFRPFSRYAGCGWVTEWSGGFKATSQGQLPP